MKNIAMYMIQVVLLIAIFEVPLQACDLCGCSASNPSMGILPAFRKHFTGFRYQRRSFNTTHPHTVDLTEQLSGKDNFQSVEWFSRFAVHENWQIFVNVPFHFFNRSEEALSYCTKGIGDISMMAMILLLDNTKDPTRSLTHALQLGMGAKAPVGRYTLRQDGFLIHPNLQPGTGTWDFPFSALYTIRFKKWGLNTETQYRINGRNDLKYDFGNSLFVAGRLFYWYSAGDITFLPQAGIQWEHRSKDRRNNLSEPYTGGIQSQLVLGFDMYYKNFVFGASWANPVNQHLGDGLVTALSALTGRLLYLF